MALIERAVAIRSDLCFSVASEETSEERFQDGHIILLSDLLLICRVKTDEEIDNNPEGNHSRFWLLFPPLAIRHVYAKDGTVDDDGTTVLLLDLCGIFSFWKIDSYSLSKSFSIEPIVELSIVNRVKARVWALEDQVKYDWIDAVNDAQHKDANKQQSQQQQQQQQQHQGPNRNGPPHMRPMGPTSPMSPSFHNGPMSPQFQGHPGGPMSPRPRPPMLAMGGGPMGGPMSGGPMSGGPMSGGPGYRPQMSPGGGMGRPMMHNGGGSPRPPHHPNQRMVCHSFCFF